MIRSLVVGVIALISVACLMVDGGQETGPEQFDFDMRPGTGPGEEAERLAAGVIADTDTLTAADHVVWVPTPLGRIDVVDTLVVSDGTEFSCRALIADPFSSQACGDGFPEIPPTQIEMDGISSDGEWTLVEVRAGQGIRALRAQAADGTVYRSDVVRGVGILVYPVNRGSLTIQGLGANEEPEGEPVTAGEPLP
ncbi:hypothetical protein BH23ACT5_BH23ACT5_05320 [soil metagenome]